MTYSLHRFEVTCPICSEKLTGFGRTLALHAQKHDITSANFYAVLFHNGIHPTCKCKSNCLELTVWKGWNIGFLSFVRGHFSQEQIAKRTLTTVNNLKAGKHKHWTQLEKNSKVLVQNSEKIKLALTNGYANGTILHWKQTKTANELDTIYQKISTKHKLRYEKENQHWKKTDILDFKTKLSLVLFPNFSAVFDETEYEIRKNNYSFAIEVTCKRCNRITNKTAYSVMRCPQTFKCRSCDHSQISTGHQQIAEYCKSLTSANVTINDVIALGGKELDILIPSLNFGIEFNGLYWHSELVNNDTCYHEKKSLAARAHGISLFHIYEDEWHNKQGIVKSIIAAKLGAIKQKFDARKCTIQMLDIKTRRTFFETNHLDGDAKSTVAFGLIHNGNLVSALSIRKPFSKNVKTIFEIARYASQINSIVRGGHSKLLKEAIRWCKENNGTSLMTYVDNRLGLHSNFLLNFGFKHVSTTAPAFWWTDCNSVRKNRLSVKANLSNGLTESDVASLKRVCKIWGCSSDKLVFDFK
jgi:Zn finger protein HypA/HybF involved in hydrogenase expression